jgi:hypothetical protein
MSAMLKSAGLALAVFSSAASAVPVMLNCELTQHDGPLKIDVQLNEEAGTVSWTFPATGHSVTRPAIFTPDHVSFSAFSISRTDLSLQRVNDTVDQEYDHEAPVSYGKCSLDTRKRAF